MKIPKIPMDKVKHFGVGFGIAAVVGLFFQLPWLGVIAAAVAGIGKEVYDHRQNKKGNAAATVDVMDAVVTLIGGMFGAAFIQLIAFQVY
jgi:deoxyinosine 3'endonuclease (endonuclease V)